MDARQAITSRRSVRKFLDKDIPQELIEALAEAGDCAPSACNKKPVDIYVITNKDKLAELSKSGHFTKMSSPLAIVVTGNMSRTLPRGFSEYWIQDASAATENILIMAAALGLGACWNGVYLQKTLMERVSEILALDGDTVPFSLIRIGYPDEFPEPYRGYDSRRVKFIK